MISSALGLIPMSPWPFVTFHGQPAVHAAEYDTQENKPASSSSWNTCPNTVSHRRFTARGDERALSSLVSVSTQEYYWRTPLAAPALAAGATHYRVPMEWPSLEGACCSVAQARPSRQCSAGCTSLV